MICNYLSLCIALKFAASISYWKKGTCAQKLFDVSFSSYAGWSNKKKKYFYKSHLAKSTKTATTLLQRDLYLDLSNTGHIKLESNRYRVGETTTNIMRAPLPFTIDPEFPISFGMSLRFAVSGGT